MEETLIILCTQYGDCSNKAALVPQPTINAPCNTSSWYNVVVIAFLVFKRRKKTQCSKVEIISHLPVLILTFFAVFYNQGSCRDSPHAWNATMQVGETVKILKTIPKGIFVKIRYIRPQFCGKGQQNLLDGGAMSLLLCCVLGCNDYCGRGLWHWDSHQICRQARTVCLCGQSWAAAARWVS